MPRSARGADAPGRGAAAAGRAHLEAQAAADEGADVVGFLRSLERPNWVAFEITTCDMACEPVWSTAWTELDFNAVEDEDDA